MRFIATVLLGTCLFVSACADNSAPPAIPVVPGAEISTPPPAVATLIPADPTAITNTIEMTNNSDLSTPMVMTDTAALPAVTVLTATATSTASTAVTETQGITPSAQLTATGAAGLLGVATLQNVTGELVGNAIFTQNDDEMTIQVTVEGFTAAGAGLHGIHIHTTGACTPDFAAAGSHFNPTGAAHGLENPSGPHAGDLPNIEIDADGNGTYEVTTTLMTLAAGDNSLFDNDGSAMVIHAAPDDLVTDPAGASGDRIACGVIESQ